MILIVLFWVLVSIAFLGWGKLSTSILGPKVILEDFSETGHFFLGISIVGILAGLVWCVAPITPIFTGFIMGVGIGYWFASLPFHWHIEFKSPWFIASSLLFGMAVLMKSAAPTSYFDCGLYYVQSIRWAQNFSVVPGLANLHIRFGTFSSWHLLTAAFDWPKYFGGNVDDLGELVLLWFLVFHGWNSIKRTGFECYLSLCLIFAALWLAYPLLTAPSPDLAAGLIGMHTLYQFRKFLRAWNPKEPNQLNTRGLALFVQSLFLIQIKLSALPFLLVAFLVLFLIIRKGWFISSFHLIVFGLLVGIAMIYRSYILTGYAIFPAFQNGWNPDWLIPSNQVSEYMDGVRGFARYRLSLAELQSGITYEKLGQLTFFEWFPMWAKERKISEWAVILLAVSGWLLLVRFVSTRIRKSFKEHWPLIFFTWLSGMMLLFWFSNAPDVRFGMAILGMGCSYSVAAIILNLSNRIPWIKGIEFQRMILASLAFGAVVSFVDLRSIKQYSLVPPLYSKGLIDSYKNNQGKIMYAPLDDPTSLIQPGQCWDGPLPCSIKPLPGLEWRGNTLADGFRFKRSSDSAK